jgi:acyl-CoA thioesterase-1
MDMIRTFARSLLVLTLSACGADTRETGGRIETDSALASPAIAGTNGKASNASAEDERKVVLFLGTSLTAGYGLGAEFAYPAIIQQKIDSAGLPFRVVNAGLAGETSAGGLRRLEWSLQQPIDVLVLELGANDGLRGLPVDAMRANLDSILSRTRARFPDAALFIAGMEAPPNLGPSYTRAFRETYRELAEKYDAALLPFLLDGVGGRTELNQADGIHPSADGQKLLAANVWTVLEPLLRRR